MVQVSHFDPFRDGVGLLAFAFGANFDTNILFKDLQLVCDDVGVCFLKGALIATAFY